MGDYQPSDGGRWMRDTGGNHGSDHYLGDHYPHSDTDGKKNLVGLLLGGGATIVIIFFFLLRTFFGGDDPDENAATIPTGGPVVTTAAATTTVPFSDALPLPLRDVYRVLGTPEYYGFIVYPDMRNDHIWSQSSVTPGETLPEIDIAKLLRTAAFMDDSIWADPINAAFNNTTYNCADTEPKVVCAGDVLEMPVGDMYIIAVEHGAAIPTASTDRSYVYSIVFDSDGDAANDWQFNPPFDWDLYQGADRWYQAVYEHSTGQWVLTVIQVSTGNTPIPVASSARAVIDGEWVIWFVPSSELPGFPSPFRVTAFAHDGSFNPATGGADVSGADPTEPLIAFEPTE